MNSQTSRWPLWLKVLLASAALFTFAFVLCLVALVRTVRLAGDAKVLKGALLAGIEAPATTRVEISAGPILLGAARQVLAHIPDAPPEAAPVLRAVRSASVGVFEYAQPVVVERDAIVRADQMLDRRGWTRAVFVRDGESTVLVYVPRDADPDNLLPLCVAVVDGRNVVLVSGRIDPEALLPLVEQHAERRLARR